MYSLISTSPLGYGGGSAADAMPRVKLLDDENALETLVCRAVAITDRLELTLRSAQRNEVMVILLWPISCALAR